MAAERVERRLTVIVAADIAGYSRLMATDEEGTLARLKAHRKALIDPKITEHHGRITKTTGDGLLVEFVSVVDALRCVVEIQRGMLERNADIPAERRIDFRVGVNIGDVIVDGDDIYGDGVNVAARLEGMAEPGGILVSHLVRDQVLDKLSFGFDDLGEQSVKNIPRPVRTYRVRLSDEAATPLRALAPERSGPPHLSLVVLPFANLGGDPEQDYFVDGVTESLTTDLSRISGSFVIARNTAFTYKGRPFDVKKIGRELNVRYILEGSVQRGGSRMRVNVQLIDAGSGNHLWAERFDKPVADLFDMQDEIVSRLAGALDAQLIAAEARRAEQAPNPDSMDLFFQGMAWFNRGLTPEFLDQARSFFERALALDPANVDALVWMAGLDAVVGGALYSADRSARVARAEAALVKALTLAPEHALAHFFMGVVQIWTNRTVDGVAEFERALAINRNLAVAHAHIGLAKLFMGRGEETESHVQGALRLSPRDVLAYVWILFAGIAKLCLGADGEAIERFRRVIEINRNIPNAHFYLAAALAHAIRPDEARTAAKAGLSLNPAFTISKFHLGAQSDNPIYLAQRERMIDGMRKAGIPEE